MRRSPLFSNLSTKIQRLQLTVSYEGTDFRGWAAQKGQRTVQSTLKNAVRQVSGENCEIIGASRTDGGAHAVGQCCHFDLENRIPVDRWAYALNRVLPDDLVVKKCQARSKRFHSRFSARDRWYRYRILIGDRDPMRARFCHWYWDEVDVDLMNNVAQNLVGSHDFRGFSEEMAPDSNTVREVLSISVKRSGSEVHVDVLAQAFIRGMMRRISGGLLEVGRGARDPNDIKGLLNVQQREKLQWPVVLPAKGLTLMRIRYGGRPWFGDEPKNDLEDRQEEIDE
jgi:tRNA pseudouridine38-40 synthase